MILAPKMAVPLANDDFQLKNPWPEGSVSQSVNLFGGGCQRPGSHLGSTNNLFICMKGVPPVPPVFW